MAFCQLQAQSWTADNGNGTFTNPLFYDEFTDPDLIRVGTDYYMVASSMHAMPGLPLLRSKDLVNWEFVTYIFDKLDLGPDFHLEGDKGIYGNGIWAPAIRYHKGTFYVFVNVNDHGLQVFSAKNPAGPGHTRIWVAEFTTWAYCLMTTTRYMQYMVTTKYI